MHTTIREPTRTSSSDDSREHEFEAEFAADMLEEQRAAEAKYAADLRAEFVSWS